MRQVPNVTFLTQPEPALINTGEGVISLFNCSSRPIKINKGDLIAECADINNDFNLPALHDSMRLLTMHSLFFAQDEFEISQIARSQGSSLSKRAPKTIFKTVTDRTSSVSRDLIKEAASALLPGRPDKFSKTSFSAEDKQANKPAFSNLPAEITCSSCTLTHLQVKFSRSQLKKFGTRARCIECVNITEKAHSYSLYTSETARIPIIPSFVSQSTVLHCPQLRRPRSTTVTETDLANEKHLVHETKALLANIIQETKRLKRSDEHTFPILIDGKPVKPAMRADVDIPDESEVKEAPEPRPAHIGEDGVHYGDGFLGEVKISILKRLIADTKLFEPYPVGTTTDTIKATFQTTGKPPYCRPYRTSPTDRIVIRKLIDELIRQKRIQVSNSPYASPIHIVKKKDGGHRLTVDFRLVNKILVPQRFPMPRIDDLLANFDSVEYISTLDMSSAFFQISLATEADRHLSAFTTEEGHYEHLVLPQGMSVSPSIMQRLSDEIIRDLKAFAAAYLDDIVIFSKSWDEHIIHLRQVFEALRKHKIAMSPNKTRLAQTSTRYLGFIISRSGISKDPRITAAIRDFQHPNDLTLSFKKKIACVHSFLGLCNFYRRFIPEFAKEERSLRELTRKDLSEWIWEQKHEDSFKRLKDLLCSDQILAFPAPVTEGRHYVVTTDFSYDGISAILSQWSIPDENGERKLRPVYYASRTLSKSEKNYSPTAGEALAIVFAVELFRPYIGDTHFKVITDHRALVWLFGQTTTTKQTILIRWALRLQQFDFEVIYRKGTENQANDSLSRYPQKSTKYDLKEPIEPLYMIENLEETEDEEMHELL